MSTTTRSSVQEQDQEKQNPGQLNSVQLNIVSIVNMERATEEKSLENALYMMDNSVGGTGQGTPHLETVVKQGQVLNWIIRPIDMEKRPDGTWPPMPKINNIVVLDTEIGDEEDVAEKKIFTELKIYGGPDRMRDKFTPVYYYWAGTVLSTAKPGVYNYRLVVELEQEDTREKLYLNTYDHPSIRVLAV
ncbi:hypothetical protein GCM10010329_40430 [Streptomyces spiroverticillatus]|uniref:Uncharacterized protein n=1 Tax=Streptomyces finlayi TaxID=67296 RepID=A0A919CAY9_9ACTN|nr:hypothetical protein [Streptomyces finlayi]GHA13510.1 hypothetical protein GCM10010329_40430 [Streptomyces spiroverticillatus]GHC97898.1 hypothetical protein GCM10010334_39810 [Streptomyces finlayi]